MAALKGKVALLTGASGGLGQEFANILLKNNVKGLSLLDIKEDKKFEQTLLKNFGKEKILFIPTDVTSNAQLRGYEQTVRKFNNLDIVINNAGILNEENWLQIVNVNLLGVMKSMYIGMQLYFPKYKSGNEAYMVNVASILGLAPIPAFSAHSTTNCALISMSMTYGSKYYFDKYKTNLITLCPGFTDTDFLKHVKTADFGSTKLKTTAIESIQKPEIVGKALLAALTEGTNGSVWLSQSNKNEKLNIHKIFEPLRKKTGMILK